MHEEHLTDEQLRDALRSSEQHEKRLAEDLAEQKTYTAELRRVLAEREAAAEVNPNDEESARRDRGRPARDGTK